MLYVLDQNYLRAEELRNLITIEPQSKFIIPDIALLEMCKGNQWKETILRSLAILSVCPGRVFHSCSIGEGLNYELRHGESIEGKLLPRDFRDFTRAILANVAVGGAGDAIDMIRAKILDAQRDIQLAELNHLNNQRSLLRRVEIIESVLAGEPLRLLRSGKASREDRLALIRNVSLDLCSTFLQNHGLSRNRIRMLLKQKPLVLRFFYVNVRHCVDWTAKGGVLTMAPERISNDILDQDYVLVGSFFDRLLSKETRVQEADADLREIMRNG
jgi:hypothetical protein